MASQIAVAPPPLIPSVDGPAANDDDVRQREAQVQAVEVRLIETLGALERRAQGVIERLEVIQEAVSVRYLDGADDPRSVALLQRYQNTAVPSLDIGNEWETARAARLAAVATRERIIEEITMAAVAYRDRLEGLGHQLDDDEAELQRLRAAQAAAANASAAPPAQQGAPPVIQGAPPPVTRGAPPPVQAEPPAAPPPTVAPQSAAAPLPEATPAPESSSNETAEPFRAHPRARLRAAVTFESENNFFTGFTSDLSEGGVFIATINVLPVGTQVELTVALPDDNRVTAIGEVRWLREWNDMTPDVYPGMGIQFVQVPDEAAAVLADFLSVREPMFYDT